MGEPNSETTRRPDVRLKNTVTKESLSVLAVIVSYNPAPHAIQQSVFELNQQGCSVLVVDNASKDIDQWSESLNAAELIKNTENLGLGAAHNQGIEYAKSQGYRYVLILDQDSLPMDNMVAQLLKAHTELAKEHKISAVGACYFNRENQSESFFVRFGWLKFQREYANKRVNHGRVMADFLISSGSLFSIDTLKDVGGMDEALFIDHVDTEWFLRARHQGYQAFGVRTARMQHGLGESTHQISLGGRQRNVPQHKPFRYYYIFRNSILLYKRGYTAWCWKWNDLQRLVMIFVMFGCLKKPRWQNMRMMLLGAWHGVLGKTGSITEVRRVASNQR